MNNINTFLSKLKPFFYLAIIILVFSFVVSLNPFVRVEYGTIGVIDQFGRISRSVGPGLHFKIPFVENVRFYTTQKVIYETEENPIASQQLDNVVAKSNSRSSVALKQNIDAKDFPVDTSTADGQQISIRYTVRYALDPDSILQIAETIGTQEQVAQRIVKAQSRSVARNVAREFSASELYTGDIFKYQTAVADKLKENFEKNGVVLDEFLVRQIKFSDQYVTAVEQKQIESERVKTEEFKAEQEQFKSEQLIIRAEGEAAAQEILTESLNGLVLEKQALEKWDGKLPTYMGGNGEVPFINIQ